LTPAAEQAILPRLPIARQTKIGYLGRLVVGD